jgi:hypothetical protein
MGRSRSRFVISFKTKLVTLLIAVILTIFLLIGYNMPIETVTGPINHDACLGDYQVGYSLLLGEGGEFQHDKKIALSGSCYFEKDPTSAANGTDDRVRLKLYLF